jgi:hypothetical protein
MPVMREPGRRSNAVHAPGSEGQRALPRALRTEIDRAGFYPAVVTDVLGSTLAGEAVTAHLVHLETTFDVDDDLRRHVTVLALTETRLVIVHADDHTDSPDADRHGPVAADPDAPPAPAARTYAAVTAEAIPLSGIHGVVTTHIVDRPEGHRPGTPPLEVTIGVAWGIASRIDLEPAACDNPDCDADHGYTGSVTADDLSLRVSAAAEGRPAVDAALAFARALSAATVRRP